MQTSWKWSTVYLIRNHFDQNHHKSTVVLMGPAYSAPLMLAVLTVVEIAVVVYTVKGLRSVWRSYWDTPQQHDD